MSRRLEGKVAIVTGGGAGIGEAISKKFAREGAAVVVVGFAEDPVGEVVEDIVAAGGRAVAFTGDISDQATAEACVQQALSQFGKLDVLVNNAGVFPATDELDKYPVEAFEYMIKNNIYTVFHMSRAALPYLQKTRGNIISAGSEAGQMGSPNITPYGGTKAWVMTFSKGLAVEQAKYGVRVNCVGPGPIDTAWTHKETGPMDKKMEKNTVEGVPMGRRGTPEEVANVYLFLASDEASYVTGATYFVDGGVTSSKSLPGEEVPSELKKEPAGELVLNHSQDGHAEIRPEDTGHMSS
ncbi:SDR family NAD(P)-dependent oxidoreductase [Hymenobacter chitinivorans]|uniref:NAD(P)-dependent dehydrogenase (Short-subunit alcohol dehydrogenase family) n=1 Tax=Hymenobacter chitinivorans DSM 11115 TaxID=1121954 RepID=A0A2M9BA10_9BACT|nr:SDR family oxidoreductase [Hymenobacter chitinivorans]PJJ54774.1 NAD(P)-dependent dehydrogenase (short-subunit alcohol dehydrogenase family) [Hymenobacter chitinivorans DSM 11115]